MVKLKLGLGRSKKSGLYGDYHNAYGTRLMIIQIIIDSIEDGNGIDQEYIRNIFAKVPTYEEYFKSKYSNAQEIIDEGNLELRQILNANIQAYNEKLKKMKAAAQALSKKEWYNHVDFDEMLKDIRNLKKEIIAIISEGESGFLNAFFGLFGKKS